MSDTSKMTPEQYKAKTDAQVKGQKPPIEVLREKFGAPMQTVPFQPGQTVWVRGKPGRFVCEDLGDVVVRMSNDCSLEAHSKEIVSAIDPNAAPEPSKPKPCPFCGSGAGIHGESSTIPFYVQCRNRSCFMEGPMRPTAEEAIAAWDSIRIVEMENQNDRHQKGSVGENTHPGVGWRPLQKEDLSQQS